MIYLWRKNPRSFDKFSLRRLIFVHDHLSLITWVSVTSTIVVYFILTKNFSWTHSDCLQLLKWAKNIFRLVCTMITLMCMIRLSNDFEKVDKEASLLKKNLICFIFWRFSFIFFCYLAFTKGPRIETCLHKKHKYMYDSDLKEIAKLNALLLSFRSWNRENWNIQLPNYTKLSMRGKLHVVRTR